MIMVLGWGICILILLMTFRSYVKKTNKLIEKLYKELLERDKRDWFHEEMTVESPNATVPIWNINQFI